jgi:peptidoglycan/LPS O-acetylase OafA/YrhL
VADLERGAFDLSDFYARRLRRLLPALLVVLVVVFVLDWLLLFAGEYKALGRDMAGAAALADGREPTRILGHLWPVAAFVPYVAWPLLLQLFRKRPGVIDAVIGTSSAFFLATNLSRGWELMAGCGLASLQRRKWHWHGLGADDGRYDDCHLNGLGREKHADGWVTAITAHRD